MKIKLTSHDIKWSLLVRERDKACLVCGRSKLAGWKLDAHHFIKRSVNPTRLMIENGITLCFIHHTSSHEFSAHKTPEAFKEWFKSTFPETAALIEAKAKTYMNRAQAIKEFKEKYK